MARCLPGCSLPARIGALGAALLTAAVLLVAAAPPSGAVVPHTPAGLPAAIEPMPDYTAQVSCDPHVRPGTAGLASLLAVTYPAAPAWNSTYACGTDGSRSEHYDGRAIDWMVDVHNPAQLAAARSMLGWLLGTDRAGNRFSMARRLGVMYVIYDNRMWGGWSGRWEDYNGCSTLPSHADDNACHRTHMHISLTWNGAMGRTSFWATRPAAAEDHGPCRVAGLNWAPRYSGPNPLGCPDVAGATAGPRASAVRRALVTFSGAEVGPGSSGPAVTAVQQALGVRASGWFGPATATAVRRFQTSRHLAVYGWMSSRTWQALLPTVR